MKSYPAAKIVALPLFALTGPAAAYAEWSLTSRGTLFYTDDAGIFSATRRLIRDVDRPSRLSMPGWLARAATVCSSRC